MSKRGKKSGGLKEGEGKEWHKETRVKEMKEGKGGKEGWKKRIRD